MITLYEIVSLISKASLRTKRSGRINYETTTKLISKFVICLLFSSSNLFAGDPDTSKCYFLRPAKFCAPFVSELESNKVSMELNYATNSEVYDMACSGKKNKVFQNTNLGIDIPFYTKVISTDNKPDYGYSFSAPISFHLWWDPFEESTSPVLNTTYKFSPINFKYIKFYDRKMIKNVSFKIAPFNHESCHIGDELAMFSVDSGITITRINVSYAYTEMNLTLNDPNGSYEAGQSLRIGWKYRINGTEGFYTANVPDSDSILIPPSGPKAEFYVQYNLIRDKGFLTTSKWVNVVSAEVRSQIRYQYNELHAPNSKLFESTTTKTREFSVNAYMGWKYKRTESPSLGIYLHAYAGLNPYGQFRNHAGFKSIGVSFIID